MKARLATACALLTAACGGPSALSDAQYDAAAKTVGEAAMSRRLDALASDAMLGRGPGERGETLAVAYIAAQMRAIGLEPLSADSSYLQPVPLLRASASGSATFRANGRLVSLSPATAMVFGATAMGEHRLRDAPVVFVGYGIVAPEHAWDDYGTTDLRGKVALILDGEPSAVSRQRFGTHADRSPHAFAFLKARHAVAHGASGVLLVREGSADAQARRRWRLQDAALLGTADDPMAESPITIHLSADAGQELAHALGTSLEAWKRAAEQPAGHPTLLALRLDATVSVQGTSLTSRNVVGLIRGSDPVLREECVVYLAHWDAFGVGPAVNGDSIYNGALDDAAGVSAMLLAAEAMRALPRAPRRTVVFVATTAEEEGMRGTNAYAAAPVCPLHKTALAVGMDWTFPWGMTDTISSNGIGYSTVDSLARAVAERHGKAFGPGVGEYWMASDHAALALRGVPAWFGGLDGEVRGKPAGWTAAQWDAHHSHVPTDERGPNWNLAGAVFEAQYLFELGARAAESDARPRWTVPSEFKAAAARSAVAH